MQFNDLTQYTYDELKKSATVLNIGWLESEKFLRGSFPEDCMLILQNLTKWSVHETRGLHQCPFCKECPVCHEIEGINFMLGSAEIFVTDGKQFFLAPNMLLHYVKMHNYLPPEAFIETLRAGLHPTDEQYIASANSFGMEVVDTPIYEGGAPMPPRDIGKLIRFRK